MGLCGVALKVGFLLLVVQAKEIGLRCGRDLPTIFLVEHLHIWLRSLIYERVDMPCCQQSKLDCEPWGSSNPSILSVLRFQRIVSPPSLTPTCLCKSFNSIFPSSQSQFSNTERRLTPFLHTPTSLYNCASHRFLFSLLKWSMHSWGWGLV